MASCRCLPEFSLHAGQNWLRGADRAFDFFLQDFQEVSGAVFTPQLLKISGGEIALLDATDCDEIVARWGAADLMEVVQQADALLLEFAAPPPAPKSPLRARSLSLGGRRLSLRLSRAPAVEKVCVVCSSAERASDLRRVLERMRARAREDGDHDAVACE